MLCQWKETMSSIKSFLEYEITYSSPTASNEAVLSTDVIGARERRDVCTAHIPGAYLHAVLPKGKKGFS